MTVYVSLFFLQPGFDESSILFDAGISEEIYGAGISIDEKIFLSSDKNPQLFLIIFVTTDAFILHVSPISQISGHYIIANTHSCPKKLSCKMSSQILVSFN
jgi:hypothetical protein